MRSHPAVPRPGRGGATAVLSLLTLAASACGSDGPSAPPDQPTTGTLVVVTETHGDDLDPDGFALLIGGSTYRDPLQGSPLGTADSLVLGDEMPGPHFVELGAIAGNCVAEGPNPRWIDVLAGETARLLFVVNCARTTAIEVQVVSSGPDLDVDGYIVVMDDLDSTAVGVNGIVRLPRIPVGPHQLRLFDVAGNCVPNGVTSVGVTAMLDQVARVDFQLTCTQAIQRDLLFMAKRFEALDGPADIYLRSADGGTINLTEHPANDSSLAWSPDGTRIAFLSDRSGTVGLFTMNADGSNLRTISAGDGSVASASWAPDGRSLVYARGDLYVDRLDGSSPTRLTTGRRVTTVAWSPDGARIAFIDGDIRGVNFQLLLISPEDGAVTAVATPSGYLSQPAWSPNGRELAFVVVPPSSFPSFGVASAYVVRDPALPPLHLGACSMFFAWSPDGAQLLCGASILRTDGGGATSLPLDDVWPNGPVSWAPNDSQIAYSTRPVATLEWHEVWVMGADGSRRIRITGPALRASSPAWRPGN